MERRRGQIPHDVQSLDFMSRRLRDGDTPSQRQVEEVLERGFGKLMQLEAELQRRKAEAAEGSDPEAAAELGDLEEGISALQDALTALRTVSSPPGPPRIGYGFVLPRRRSAKPCDED